VNKRKPVIYQVGNSEVAVAIKYSI